MTERVHYKRYKNCCACGLELDDYNYRIGSAYHKECWMREIDTERELAPRDNAHEYPEFRWNETPLYINGRRAKDYGQ